MITSLVKSEALPLESLRDANATADLVCWLGISDLENMPARKYEVDQDGIISWLEPERAYVQRVWPELPRETKSLAIVAGLQKAAAYREALNDGIQLVCYRAYKYGWWVATQSSGGDEAAFRAWIKEAVTAEDGSTTEATQLASTILNLVWLKANGYRGIPRDLETIFFDRAVYNRWRRKASELRQLIQSKNDVEEEEEVEDEIDKDIQQAIADINDTSKTFEDLDQRVSGSRAPKIIMIMTGYDELGRQTFEGTVTPTQLTILRSRLGNRAEWRLKGETYGITDKHALVEYRHTISYTCPRCRVEYGEPDDSCIACRNDEELVLTEAWARRTWDNKAGWSAFERCKKPDVNSNGEGAPLHDPDLGVTYTRQWEEVDDES